MEKTHTDLKKIEEKYIKLRTDYILKMTKEEKEDEVKDCLMHHYMIL